MCTYDIEEVIVYYTNTAHPYVIVLEIQGEYYCDTHCITGTVLFWSFKSFPFQHNIIITKPSLMCNRAGHMDTHAHTHSDTHTHTQ